MENFGLSVIIPIFNEVEAIQGLNNRIISIRDSISGPIEFILVNDGSNDGTERLLEDFNCENVTIHHHPYNLGYGAALKSGIITARYSWIAITDADDTYPDDQLSLLFEQAHLNNFDMVTAARTGKTVRVPFIRRPAKFLINFVANRISGFRIPDLNSGMRVIKKEIVMKHINLLCDGFSFTSTLSLVMHCGNYRVKYMPINYYRRTGKSKIRPLYDTMNFFILIITTILYFRPLRVLLPIALFFLFSGVLLSLIQAIFIKNITTFALLLLQTGFSAFIIALLADLIVKTRNN